MASRFVRILAPRHLAGLRNSTYSKAVKPRFQVGRTFHSSAQCRSGFANVLADAPAPAVQVKTITKDGIELVDGLLLSGPCIFLNGKVFLWETSDFGKNGNWDSWTKDMFEMFEVVVPKPEILLIGTGKSTVQLPPALRAHLSSIGLSVDTMDTWNACSTYNLLAEEGRRVAAALLPSSPQPAWKD